MTIAQKPQDSPGADRAVLSFMGWPDAGNLIESTLKEVRKNLVCELVERMDMEGFWHAEALRPRVIIRHSQMQRLEWPQYELSVCTRPPARPLLVGSGPEPSLNWRAFGSELMRRLTGLGIREIVLLGSLYDEVFHDEVVISGVVQDHLGYNKARELGCQQIDYAGPSAVHSVIMDEALNQDIHCLTIWAHFPFYLKSESELLTAHLTSTIGKLFEMEFPVDHLLNAWQTRREEIESTIQQDPQLLQALDGMKEELMAGRKRQSAKVLRFDEFRRKRNGSPASEPD